MTSKQKAKVSTMLVELSLLLKLSHEEDGIRQNIVIQLRNLLELPERSFLIYPPEQDTL